MEANNQIATALADSAPVSIGNWTFHADTLLLECGDNRVKLEPRVAYLLYYLAEKAGAPVSRAELIDQVWSGMVVGDEALTGAINKLRKALGDDSHQPEVIKTIPKIGYQLIANVEFKQAVQTGDKPESATNKKLGYAGYAVIAFLVVAGAFFLVNRIESPEKTSPFAQSDKPSIVVLPFTNMTGHADQEFFSDGLSEDITTSLAQDPTLLVISRHSSFAYKNKALTASEIGEVLNARYVLEGSVQMDNEKVRVSAQLIDTSTDQHVWAQKFDGEMKDYFSIRDDVVYKIAVALGGSKGRIRRNEAEKAMLSDPATLDAHRYFLRGKSHRWKGTREGIAQARATFEEGMAKFPDYVLLYPPVGWMYFFDIITGSGSDPQESLRRGIELGHKTLAAPQAGPEARYLAHWLLGKLYFYEDRDPLRSLAEYDKAELLNPNDPDLKASKAEILIWMGRPDDAIRVVREAIRVNPHHPPFYLRWLGYAHYAKGDYRQAVEILQPLDYGWSSRHRALAASHARLGNMEAARDAIARLREGEPAASISHYRSQLPYQNPEDLERELADLRLAGLPD